MKVRRIGGGPARAMLGIAVCLLAGTACSRNTPRRAETAAQFEVRMLARGGSYGVTKVRVEDDRLILEVNRHLRNSLRGDAERARRLAPGFLEQFSRFRNGKPGTLEFHYQQKAILLARLEDDDSDSVVLTQLAVPSDTDLPVEEIPTPQEVQ